MPITKAALAFTVAASAVGLITTPAQADEMPPAPAPTSTSANPNPLVSRGGFYHPYAWALEGFADQLGGSSGDSLRHLAQSQTTRWLTGSDQDLDQLSQMTTGGVRDRGAEASDAMPSVVLYNVPKRDCGLYSAGGAANADAYRAWVDNVSKTIGDSKIAVVIEPDALHVVNCLSEQEQSERLGLINYATQKLKKDNPHAVAYLAAGDAGDVNLMADRLKQAGIANTRGLALNVAGYQTTDHSITYGQQLDAALGTAYHFVIDTSRNGAGPSGETGEGAWCNPPGRTVGQASTTDTGDPSVDAFLWIKDQESDGACSNSNPVDPVQYSLTLAQNSGY